MINQSFGLFAAVSRSLFAARRIQSLALTTVLAAMFVLGTASEARAACEQDTDCKGDRVCVQGACVAPLPSTLAPARPAAPVRCVRQNDCQGTETCVSSFCTPSNASQPPAPVPAKTPAAPASPRSCERDSECSSTEVCESRRCVQAGQTSSPSPAPPVTSAPLLSAPLPKQEAPASPPRDSSPRPAPAPGPAGQAPFGKRGQFVPLGFISYQSTGYNYPSPPQTSAVTSRSSFSFAPGLEYFVADSFFLGGRLGYTSTSANTDAGAHSDLSNFFLGPIGGYNIPVNERFSVRLSVGALVHSGSNSSTSSNGTKGPETKQSWYSVVAEAMFLVHPASHMYIGFGPSYEREFSTKVTSANGTEADGTNFSYLAFSTLIGTWF